NPWRAAVGIALPQWQATPLAEHRARLSAAERAAAALDATQDPRSLPFASAGRLEPEIAARRTLAQKMQLAFADAAPEVIARWAQATPAAVQTTRSELLALGEHVKTVASGPLDAELALVNRSAPMLLPAVLQAMVHVAAYAAIAHKWYRW